MNTYISNGADQGCTLIRNDWKNSVTCRQTVSTSVDRPTTEVPEKSRKPVNPFFRFRNTRDLSLFQESVESAVSFGDPLTHFCKSGTGNEKGFARGNNTLQSKKT